MLHCAPNFRDLAGIAADGGIIQPGRVYRSEAVHAPDAGDAACLSALGLRTVIDLRSAAERGEAPGYWPGQQVEVHGIELAADPRRVSAMEYLRGDSSATGVRAFLSMGYEAFPNACALAVRTMFELVADRRTPLLVHCTAGKDRTGFLIAMLLLGVGASFEHTLGDYLKSGKGISAANVEGSRFAVNHRLETPLDEGGVSELIGVRAEFLAASLRVIESEFGSVRQYLEAVGVEAAKIDQARAHLIT